MPSDPIVILGLAGLAMLVSLWAAIEAYREAGRLEAAGWVMFGTLLAGVFLNQLVHGPDWVADALVGLSFAVGLPIGWIGLRRRMR